MPNKKDKQNVGAALAIALGTNQRIVNRRQPIQKIDTNTSFMFGGKTYYVEHIISVLGLKEIVTKTDGGTKIVSWHPDIVSEIIKNQEKYK